MTLVRKLAPALALAGLLAAAGAARLGAAPAPETTSWVADGADVVVHVNVRQMLDSPAMKKGGTDALKEMIDKDATAKSVFEATGLDPLKDITSITLSGVAAPGKAVKGLLVARGRFDLDKIQAAAEKFAKDKPAELKLSKSDSTQLYEIKVKENAAVAAFLDGTTLVVTPTKEATLDALKTAGRRPARVSEELEAALAKFTGKESVTLALGINDEMKKQLGKIPQAAEIAPNLKSVSGALELTDAAALGVVVKTDSEEAAGKLQALAKQGMTLLELLATTDDKVGPFMGDLLKATKLEQVKTNLTISVKVTEDMVNKATKKDK